MLTLTEVTTNISYGRGMDRLLKIFRYIAKNRQQFFFCLLGLIFVGFCLFHLWIQEIAIALATFVMAFISFIWSNLSRFKHFKGLGIEAELWEDKQKEAANLIERLQSVVTIYTHETVMMKVKEGRYGGGNRWKDCWELYDKLIKQHSELGQKIDFSELKSQMEIYFLFDIVNAFSKPLHKTVSDAAAEARQKISEEFGSPITDPEGCSERNQQLNDASTRITKPFDIASRENLAAYVIEWCHDRETKFREYFEIEVEFNQDILDRLETLSELWQSRPLAITNEIISLADRD